MMEQKSMYALAMLFGCLLYAQLQTTNGACNICSNGRACLNETSFYVCFGEDIDKSQVFTCPNDQYCSQTSLGCVESPAAASCKPNTGCDLCDGTKLFACTSRTTFAQCNGTELTAATGTCPAGMLCDSTKAEICQDICNATPECEREAAQ